SSTRSGVVVDQAFIELGGLKVGKFYSWWDDGLSGESDVLSTNALFNSIRYTYDAGSFWAGVSVDELEGITLGYEDKDNNVGIAAGVGAKLGA
ncbi:porin, partial [Staphylococcus aureus]|uniref:porin n=1 Tax=Staphylococcus aureus TaxID=1280 RepID=UPI0038B2B78F